MTPPKKAVHAVDARSDWQRLPDDARTRLAAALAKKRFSVAASSPHFLARSARAKAGLGTALDALHAALFDDDDDGGGGSALLARTTASIAARVGGWAGASGGREAAAALYLRLTRLFETWKTYEVHALAYALQLVRLSPSATVARATDVVSGLATRALHEILAHYLVAPRQGALFTVPLEDGGAGFRGTGVTVYDLAPPALLRASYGAFATCGAVEVALGATYTTDATSRRLSITHNRFSSSRPPDLTVPRVLDDPPPARVAGLAAFGFVTPAAASPSHSPPSASPPSPPSSDDASFAPRAGDRRPRAANAGKAVEVRRVGGDGVWSRFPTQKRAIDAYADLTPAILAAALAGTTKKPKWEARRPAPSPATVLDAASPVRNGPAPPPKPAAVAAAAAPGRIIDLTGDSSADEDRALA